MLSETFFDDLFLLCAYMVLYLVPFAVAIFIVERKHNRRGDDNEDKDIR